MVRASPVFLPSEYAVHYADIPRKAVDLLVSLLMSSSIIEVVQQSKARKKDDFLVAFSPVIAEATATAYKGAVNEVQQKLRRVVEVWRQRQIFELPIQEAIESRIDGMSSSLESNMSLSCTLPRGYKMDQY